LNRWPGEIEGADVQSLRQFVGQSPWAVEQIQQKLAEKVVDLLAEPEVWMIDETSFPKAGTLRWEYPAVLRALGKIANCQVAVSLHWSTCEASCPLAWRLYLPQSWLATPARRGEGRFPKTSFTGAKTSWRWSWWIKCWSGRCPIRQSWLIRPAGNDFDFRAGLRERGLQYAVAVEPGSKVWTSNPSQTPVAASKPRGRPRQYPTLKDLPEAKTLAEVARDLPKQAWHNHYLASGNQSDLMFVPVCTNSRRLGRPWPGSSEHPSVRWNVLLI